MIDACDSWDLFRSSEHRARKPHVCGECHRQIAVGEFYQYAFGLMEGEAMTMKSCSHCYAAGRWLQIVCGGWAYGMVGEELRDHWRDEPQFRSSWLAGVIEGMRRAWSAPGGLLPVPEAPPAGLADLAGAEIR